MRKNTKMMILERNNLKKHNHGQGKYEKGQIEKGTLWKRIFVGTSLKQDNHEQEKSAKGNSGKQSSKTGQPWKGHF